MSFLIVVSLICSMFSAANAAQEIDEINNAIQQNEAKWKAKDTSVSKLSPEARSKRLGAILPVSTGREKVLTAAPMALPVSVDWRNYAGNNYVTPVKEQGECGICWAFATTAAFESSVLISKNTPTVDLDLSEQVLASCGYAGTCFGGYIDRASDFIRDFGLPVESCYPYARTEGICADACTNWQSDTNKISDWFRVAATVDAIKYALYNYGPLVTILTAEGYHSASIVGYDDAEQTFIASRAAGVPTGVRPDIPESPIVS